VNVRLPKVVNVIHSPGAGYDDHVRIDSKQVNCVLVIAAERRSSLVSLSADLSHTHNTDNTILLPTLTMSLGVGIARSRPSVCLFVCLSVCLSAA